MDKIETLQKYFALSSENISMSLFLQNIALCFLLSFLLSLLYSKYGSSLSNRKAFSKNFVLLSITTMLIISIIKSSFALSLGLVGALSIVRYRGAIKEPEELTYLFLCISIGLGVGANQGLITATAFIIISIIIIIQKSYFDKKTNVENLFLNISYKNDLKINFENVLNVINQNCDLVELKKLDDNNENLEASFLVEFKNIKNLTSLRNSLKKINKKLNFEFIDNKNFF
jgi:hypothetical protein